MNGVLITNTPYVLCVGPMAWVHRHIEAGTDPRELLQKMVPSETVIPEDLDNMTLWRIILNLVAEPPRRKKLKHVNTMEDVISLLKSCSRVMVLTGAGVRLCFNSCHAAFI